MPAVIQRLIPGEDGLPTVQVAVRVEALFTEHEWEWSADRDAAFVWPDYAAADAAARAMGDGAHPAIRAVQRPAGVDSQRVYQETCKRLGEHDE